MIRIVIVEDEILVAHFMSETLKKMGHHVVKIIHKFEGASETIRQIQPDILLLDINLGTKETQKGGIEIAEALKNHNILTIFITAYNDDRTLKDALKQNPENYIIKPFTEESIKISIQLALNKLQTRLDETVLFPLCAQYTFDATSKYILHDEEKIALTATELSVLELLCNRSNTIVTHDDFQNYVWEFKSVTRSTVRELLTRLRKKIPCLEIQNHSGIGYELILRG